MIPRSQCNCECHINPHVCHCMPCCYPDDVYYDLEKKMRDLEQKIELGTGVFSGNVVRPVRQHQAKPQYCCKEFRKLVEHPETVFNRETTFTKHGNEWWTDFSDGEYGDIKLTFCPFCGKKL